MGTPFLGQIAMFGGTYAPAGWAMCNGQLMSISQYTALYSLLGTTYGGDGQSTFGLPNLQSRVPIHVGTGQSLSSYVLGQVGGAADVTLTTAAMPSHSHVLNATQAAATTATIGNKVLPGKPTAGQFPNFYAAPVQGQPTPIAYNLATGAVSMSGGSLPHSNLMPSLCVTFIIALAGVYPSRS